MRADRRVEWRQLRRLAAASRAHRGLPCRATSRQCLRHIRNAHAKQLGLLANPRHPPMKKTVARPVSPSARCRQWHCLCRDGGRRSDLNTSRHNPGFDIAPSAISSFGPSPRSQSDECARPCAEALAKPLRQIAARVDSEATARRAGSSSSGHAGCRLGRCVDLGRCCRSRAGSG